MIFFLHTIVQTCLSNMRRRGGDGTAKHNNDKQRATISKVKKLNDPKEAYDEKEIGHLHF